MITPSSHGDDAGEDHPRRGTVGGRSVTQLAEVVQAPGPEATISLEGEGVVIPSCHSNDAGEDFLGRGTVSGRPVAQLPVFV